MKIKKQTINETTRRRKSFGWFSSLTDSNEKENNKLYQGDPELNKSIFNHLTGSDTSNNQSSDISTSDNQCLGESINSDILDEVVSSINNMKNFRKNY